MGDYSDDINRALRRQGSTSDAMMGRLALPLSILGDIVGLKSGRLPQYTPRALQAQPTRSRPRPRPPVPTYRAVRPFSPNTVQGLGGALGFGQGAEQSGPNVFEELLGLQDPSRYLMDETSLRQQAEAAANAQYNPLIAALKQQMSGTQERAGRYKGELGALYGGLARSLKQDIPEIQEEYDVAERETGREFKDLERSIKGQYAQSQKEQEAMLKRLNIEAAAPDVLPEQQADRDYFVNRAKQEAQTERTALGQEERGDVGYAREGAQIAQLTGAERRADLMAQLEELVQGYEGQIGAHRAARSQAVEAGFGQLQSQNMEAAQGAAQREFQNRLAMLQYERQLSNDQFKQLQDSVGEEPGPVKNYQDIVPTALRFLEPLGGGQREAQNIASVINSILDNPDVGEGPEGRLNSFQLAQRAMEEGKRRRLGPAQLAALRQIAQDYFR